MSEPLVSILVPVYNAEPFLRECIDSIVNQTYRNLQIILIDDGSTDGSWAILQDYATQDKRIEIHHQSNHGVATTRNRLIEKANGDYVLFVDSDDWIEDETISECVFDIKSVKADILNFNYRECGVIMQEHAIKLFLEHKKFRGMLWNKFIRRDLFGDSHFDEKISYGEDALMVWQLLQKTKKVAFSTKSLYHYRLHGNNISFTPFNGKKFSAYYVWQQICEDTQKRWPQYLDISHARYAIEMTLLLRDAARSKSHDTKKIHALQKVVKQYRHLIGKTHLSSWKMRLLSVICSNSLYNIYKQL